jgi:MFS family permease
MDQPSGTPDSERRAGHRHPVAAVLATPALLRVLLAYFIFSTTEWATWIAILVWAYDIGGASAAGLIAVVQLVPATLAAPLAATIGDRIRRDRALALGYLTQAVTMLVVGIALVADLSNAFVYVAAAAAATSIVLTRPVHNAIIPELADGPEQITASNAATSTVEGVAVFVGPILTGVLLTIWGPGSVFLSLGAASLLSVLLTQHLPLRRTIGGVRRAQSALRDTVAGLRELRRDAAALLLTAVVGAQFVVIGVLDILTVVLGLDILDMGQSGPGILTSALGIGALVGAASTVVLIGRRRLSPAIALGMLGTGLPLALVALTELPAVAWVLLAMSGVGKAFVDVAGRTLLQRTVAPDLLARIFGVQESLLMGGTAIGAALAPFMVNALGGRTAFVVTGLFLPVVGLMGWVRIRKLDDAAAQPGVGFPLLQSIPMFALLPQPTLERLSRELVPSEFESGATIINQGDEGDRFYVIASGSVDIIKAGVVVATTSEGGYFGEIALLRNIPRTATVRATTDVSLYSLQRDPFLEAVTGSSAVHEMADAEAQRRLDEGPSQPH